MFYIVNETSKEFTFERDENCLVLKNGNDVRLPIMLINSTDEQLDKVLAEKISEPVKAKRTTKVFPRIDSKVVLYEDLTDSDMAEMLVLDKGLDKKEYRHPKSVVIVISDSKISSILRAGEYDGVCPVTDLYTERSFGEGNEFCVDFYFVSFSKWQDMPDDIKIELPNGYSLKFGIFEYTKNDKDCRINALIRYDADGNEVKPEEKKDKKKDQKPAKKKYNYKNKKDKKRAHSDLVSRMPKHVGN